jgi:hypothetical protein
MDNYLHTYVGSDTYLVKILILLNKYLLPAVCNHCSIVYQKYFRKTIIKSCAALRVQSIKIFRDTTATSEYLFNKVSFKT